MKIAICDDEKTISEQYKKTLVEYLAANNIVHTVDCFTTGEAFMRVNFDYDIVFLDYKMPDMNGMQIAQRLREENSTICIVFITAYSEYVYSSFKFDTFRYLVKPVSQEALLEALQAFIKIYQLNRKVIVPTAQSTYFLNINSIIYFEASRKKTIVRTNDSIYCSTKNISTFEAEINNPHFIRTHRSYIVNMKYICEFNKNTITLTNGEKVAVSPKNSDFFIKSYMNYLKFSI